MSAITKKERKPTNSARLLRSSSQRNERSATRSIASLTSRLGSQRHTCCQSKSLLFSLVILLLSWIFTRDCTLAPFVVCGTT